jgi:beta-N-acetylhexosaminidase
MLLKPANPDMSVQGLREALRAGRLTEARVEESARRILAAKYDLGLTKQRLADLDRIDINVSSRASVELANEIAERAITLVRNEARLLPLSSLKPDARILNLAVTNGDDRLFIAAPFASAMARAGRRVETIVLDERSSDAEVRQALEKAQSADLVIASLYGRVRSGQARSAGLPEPGARALTELLNRQVRVVGISFGNPYLLQNFPGLQTYVVAYGDMPSLQQAAARAIAGAADITGRLPITLPSLHARGTGIQMKAQAQARSNPVGAPQKAHAGAASARVR